MRLDFHGESSGFELIEIRNLNFLMSGGSFSEVSR